MLEDFLNDLGKIMVELVRDEILTKRDRFSKSPRVMKRSSPYNFYASGKGYRSVNYEVVDQDQLYILMEDYMVDYVFGNGSWPGGGRYARGSGGQKVSPLLNALEQWIKDKRITPRDKKGRFMSVRSMAFAVRRNLFKAGYAGYNYQTPDFSNEIVAQIDFLLQSPQYQDLILNNTIQDLVDRINTLGQQTFNIALGRQV